jgi:hypothetical protein
MFCGSFSAVPADIDFAGTNSNHLVVDAKQFFGNASFCVDPSATLPCPKYVCFAGQVVSRTITVCPALSNFLCSSKRVLVDFNIFKG